MISPSVPDQIDYIYYARAKAVTKWAIALELNTDRLTYNGISTDNLSDITISIIGGRYRSNEAKNCQLSGAGVYYAAYLNNSTAVLK